LGYYDDDDQSRYQRQKGNKSGFLLASLVGAVLGGLLVIFTVPILSEYGALPYSVQPQNPPNNTEQVNQSEQRTVLKTN